MPSNTDEYLKIFILNVGQADTSVIITPKKKVVIIDAVKPYKLTDLLDKLNVKEGNEIEELIITHPHRDHFSGASRLLNDYRIMSVKLAPFWNRYGMGPPSYREMVNKIESEEDCQIDFISGYSRIYPEGALKVSNTSDPEFDKECLFIELLGPSNNMISQLERDDKLDTNHLSVVARLNWQNFKMIFAGDAQMENWAHFDNENMFNENCNVLRSAHHGSCNGTQWERISRLNPKYVIVSSDPEKKHNLPDLVGSSIFAKYEEADTKRVVTLTKNTGTIKIIVKNGKEIILSCFGDKYNKKIDFSNEKTLDWMSNLTNWKELLEKNIQKIYP